MYYQQVKSYAEQSGAKHIFFSGHIPFEQILSYYHIADLFLCMSEHEGFCIPLLEAMYFRLPVIAYESTAVPGTLNGSGVLVKEKDCEKVAKIIDNLACDEECRKRIIEKQDRRLQDFRYEKIEGDFIQMIQRYMEG